jgi:phosphatidylglycerophosphate synthase
MRAVSLLEQYRKSLKPLDIEEPIDVWVQRPVGFVIAKLSFPTPITPNQITIISIVFGLVAGFFYLRPSAHHLQWAGLCVFLSAAFDCADGALARMRKSSSALGRMLDGVADLTTTIAAVGGSVFVMASRHAHPWWHAAIVVALCGVTLWTNAFHSAGYDYYKSVFLRMTIEGNKEGEDVEVAIARFEEGKREGMSLPVRFVWWIYLFYTKSQVDFLRWFDPAAPRRLDALPTWDEAGRARFREIQLPCMKLWRNWFGFGSLVFGLAVFTAIDQLAIFMLLRLVLYNGIFFLVLLPKQRAASRELFGAPAAAA